MPSQKVGTVWPTRVSAISTRSKSVPRRIAASNDGAKASTALAMAIGTAVASPLLTELVRTPRSNSSVLSTSASVVSGFADIFFAGSGRYATCVTMPPFPSE